MKGDRSIMRGQKVVLPVPPGDPVRDPVVAPAGGVAGENMPSPPPIPPRASDAETAAAALEAEAVTNAKAAARASDEAAEAARRAAEEAQAAEAAQLEAAAAKHDAEFARLQQGEGGTPQTPSPPPMPELRVILKAPGVTLETGGTDNKQSPWINPPAYAPTMAAPSYRQPSVEETAAQREAEATNSRKRPGATVITTSGDTGRILAAIALALVCVLGLIAILLVVLWPEKPTTTITTTDTVPTVSPLPPTPIPPPTPPVTTAPAVVRVPTMKILEFETPRPPGTGERLTEENLKEVMRLTGGRSFPGTSSGEWTLMWGTKGWPQTIPTIVCNGPVRMFDNSIPMYWVKEDGSCTVFLHP